MSDEKVVGAIKHGNEEAINHVITKYSKLMWSIASSILRNVASDQDIEECVADVFVYLWKHPEKYDPQRGTLKVWLSVVARSQAIDKYRELSKNNAVPLDDTVFIEQTDICDGMVDIQIHNERYRLTKKDIRSNLERCLDMVKAQFPDKVPLIQEMIRSIR